MNVIKDIATTSGCYKAGRTITVKGLMLHSVGCNQPNPQVFANHWKKSDDVCCHGVLGADGTVIQTLPWNHRGWHCSSGSKGSGNNTHIGVEMTEPSTITYTVGASFRDNNPAATKQFITGTYKTAVELFAYLCKMYNLNPTADGVIISHSEGYKRGIASGHADVEHIWSKYGLSMDQFRRDVKATMSGAAVSQPDNIVKPSAVLYRVRKSWADSESQIGAYSNLENAKNACKDGYFVFDATGNIVYPEAAVSNTVYKVRVTADGLNIRTGASTSFDIAGVIEDKGVYTITETVGNWGKLKSGAGWICLDYTNKL